MKKFIVERKLPGAGNMTARELKDISKTTVEVISALGKPYSWVQSFVTDDKIYCIHIAENKMISAIIPGQETYRSIQLKK